MQKLERQGLLFALLGFTIFPLGDGFWKSGTMLWSPVAMGALRYAMGALALGLFLLWKEGAAAFRPRRPMVQVMRGGGMAVATAGFLCGLRFMSLVDATAIMFMSPIFTVLMAAIFLKEPVGRATWLATVGGFVGVVIVLRPNLIETGPIALLPLVAALGMSMLVIGNRLAAGTGTPLAMQFHVAAPTALALVFFAFLGHASGADFLLVDSWPPIWVWTVCALVACIATTGHWFVYLGTTLAGASSVAPFTYIQIVVAGTISWLVFDQPPDVVALAGIAIIIGSGLYLWSARDPIGVPDELP